MQFHFLAYIVFTLVSYIGKGYRVATRKRLV